MGGRNRVQKQSWTYVFKQWENIICSYGELKPLKQRLLVTRVRAKSLQSCPTLCDPMDFNPPASSAPGILQARILEWLAMPSSVASSWPRDPGIKTLSPVSPPFQTDSLPLSHQKKERKGRSVVSDSLRPHGHTVHGILQARILEWVAFSFSRGSSQPRDGTQFSLIAGRFYLSWTTREAR